MLQPEKRCCVFELKYFIWIPMLLGAEMCWWTFTKFEHSENCLVWLLCEILNTVSRNGMWYNNTGRDHNKPNYNSRFYTLSHIHQGWYSKWGHVCLFIYIPECGLLWMCITEWQCTLVCNINQLWCSLSCLYSQYGS